LARFYLMVLASVGLSALAQLALKVGVDRTRQATLGAGGELAAMLTSPLVVAGLALYGLGAVLWLFVLARAPLSFAYPFVGAGFILTALLGAAVLGETVTPLRMAGIAFIVIGCTLVARSA
jgi:drug/metabolite transporter (DMT)-like permease